MSQPVDCKKKFNSNLAKSVVKASIVTAVGYIAWQYVTRNMQQDWSKGKSYATLFAIVTISLVVANSLFILLFQRKHLYTLPCQSGQPAPEELTKQVYFI